MLTSNFTAMSRKLTSSSKYCLQTPYLKILTKAKKLDELVKDILKGQHKQKDVNQNATFEIIQCKNQCHGTIVKILVTYTKCSFVAGGKSSNRAKGVCGKIHSFARSGNKFNDLP